MRGDTSRLPSRAAIALALVAAIGCGDGPPTPIVVRLDGTWGGEDAGLIVTDSLAHVHIGCTLGDASGPIFASPDGRFEAVGTYNIDAYPVDRGIIHPARFIGQIAGRMMTLTVELTDTTVVLGPVLLIRDREPHMGPCPICRVPGQPVR
jgi:hypothetical protein